MPQAPATMTTEIVERISPVISKVIGRAQSEIDEISREPIGEALHGSARALGALDCLDDLAVAGVATHLFGTDLDSARLVDRAGVDRRARRLLHRHGLTGDARLIDIGVSAKNDAVHRDASRPGSPVRRL